MRYKSQILLNALDADNLRNLTALLDVIQPAMIVGGAVRNALLHMPIKDVDIATGLTPKDVVDRVHKAGFKAIDTGIEHGTVTVVVNGTPYEVTTLRKDVKTYGRKAEVEFLTSNAPYPEILDLFKIDAARRDLTINAMYADLHGNVFDFFDGMDDLKSKIVNFIGEPEQRIREDYLRILRFFRFSCYYAQEFNIASLNACYSLADGLNNISTERWTMEIVKILQHPFPWHTLEAMQSVLRAIGISLTTPSLTTPDNMLSMIDCIRSNEHKFDMQTSYEARLAMFSGIEGLRLSAREQRRVHAIKSLTYLDTQTDIARWAIASEDDRHFWDGIVMYDSSVDRNDIDHILHRARSFDIKGSDLIQRGHTPGAKLGQALKALHMQYCLTKCTREDLLKN
jgi:tRNA nucleotidyltransferase/poly(A) polymerase